MEWSENVGKWFFRLFQDDYIVVIDFVYLVTSIFPIDFNSRGFLFPVVLVVGYALRRGGGAGSKGGPGVPWFVAAFVVAAVVRSTCEALAPGSVGGDALPAWGWAKEVGRFVLAVALAAIGVGLDPAALIRVGPRVLAVGAAAVATMVTATLPLVLWLL